jgi:hypothetical protein
MLYIVLFNEKFSQRFLAQNKMEAERKNCVFKIVGKRISLKISWAVSTYSLGLKINDNGKSKWYEISTKHETMNTILLLLEKYERGQVQFELKNATSGRILYNRQYNIDSISKAKILKFLAKINTDKKKFKLKEFLRRSPTATIAYHRENQTLRSGRTSNRGAVAALRNYQNPASPRYLVRTVEQFPRDHTRDVPDPLFDDSSDTMSTIEYEPESTSSTVSWTAPDVYPRHDSSTQRELVPILRLGRDSRTSIQPLNVPILRMARNSRSTGSMSDFLNADSDLSSSSEFF